jgi:L-iditol 2-dehydrogenase
VVAPARNLLHVSDCLSLEEAAMIEPAAVALHALRRAGGCSVGESVVVFGAGPIGLMVAQWARAMGAARVMLVDLVREKLELAKRFGFQHVIDLREVDAVAAVEQSTGGLGADICVDAAGVPQATVQAMRVARHGGRIVLLGNPTDDVNIPSELISRMMRREVQIVGTWNSDYGVFGENDDWHRSLAGMASGVIDVKPLVTHRVLLESAWGALHMIKDRTEFYCKVLIQPNSGA